MPGDIAASFLQFVLEQILYFLCYITARLLLPVVTLGYVQVEPAPRGTRVILKWHGVHRTANGTIMLDVDLGALIGLIFWVVIVAVGVITYAFL